MTGEEECPEKLDSVFPVPGGSTNNRNRAMIPWSRIPTIGDMS